MKSAGLPWSTKVLLHRKESTAPVISVHLYNYANSRLDTMLARVTLCCCDADFRMFRTLDGTEHIRNHPQGHMTLYHLWCFGCNETLLCFRELTNSEDRLTCSRFTPTAHGECVFLSFRFHSSTVDIRTHTRRTSRGFFSAIPAPAPVARLRPAFSGEEFQSRQAHFLILFALGSRPHCTHLWAERRTWH